MPDIERDSATTSATAYAALLGELNVVLAKYGLGTLIALGLVYWLATGMSAELTAVHNALADHVRMTSFFSRQICINTARDEAGRAACEPPMVVGK